MKVNFYIDLMIVCLKNQIDELNNILMANGNIAKVYITSDFGHIELRFLLDDFSYNSWSIDLSNKELSKIFNELDTYILDNEECFSLAIKNNDEQDIILWERI